MEGFSLAAGLSTDHAVIVSPPLYRTSFPQQKAIASRMLVGTYFQLIRLVLVLNTICCVHSRNLSWQQGSDLAAEEGAISGTLTSENPVSRTGQSRCVP